MVRVLEPGSRTAAALEHSWQEWSGARLVATTLGQAGIVVQNLSFLATQNSGAAFQVSLPLWSLLLTSVQYAVQYTAAVFSASEPETSGPDGRGMSPLACHYILYILSTVPGAGVGRTGEAAGWTAARL